jgi:dTDP-4-dehydrorhamnose reductase
LPTGRPLVIGAEGRVGSAFVQLLDEPVTVSRDRLDLATVTPDLFARLLRDTDPSAVVNCAAYTDVDRAEAEEPLATTINGWTVGHMARVTAELGIPLLTFSTDYVFDGEGDTPYLESHPARPINAYGRSKLVGEEEALAAGPQVLVVRTSWVLAETHRTFVTTILERVKQGQPVRVVDDQTGCPTIAADLAASSWQALGLGARGLLHLTNRGETTWHELARLAVEKAGMDVSLVIPCRSAEFPTPARRPSYSVLGSEVVGNLALPTLAHWTQSFDRIVAGSLRLIDRDAASSY